MFFEIIKKNYEIAGQIFFIEMSVNNKRAGNAAKDLNMYELTFTLASGYDMMKMVKFTLLCQNARSRCVYRAIL